MNPMENTSTDTPAHGSSGSGAAADPLRSTLTSNGEGGAGGFDAIDTGPTSKVPQGAAVLVLVALVGGGAIFTMRQFGLGSGFHYDDISIDYPMNAQQVSGGNDYEDVLSDLTNHSLPHVALQELRPKPFELKSEHVEEREFEAVIGETPEERAVRMQAERDSALQREFTKLTLNSVIGGSRPIARISGTAVRPGDIINDVFVVEKITGRNVYLSAEGRQYTLTMSGN